MVMEILLDILCHAFFPAGCAKRRTARGLLPLQQKWRTYGRENPGGTLLLSAGDEFRQTYGEAAH